MTAEMTATIKIAAPIPITMIKFGLLVLFEVTSAAGVDGRFGGASFGAVPETGAVQKTKRLLQFCYFIALCVRDGGQGT